MKINVLEARIESDEREKPVIRAVAIIFAILSSVLFAFQARLIGNAGEFARIMCGSFGLTFAFAAVVMFIVEICSINEVKKDKRRLEFLKKNCF